MEGSFSFEQGPKHLRVDQDDSGQRSPKKKRSFQNVVRSMSTDVNSPTAVNSNFVNIMDFKDKEKIGREEATSVD
jgi:hypothetical protein